MSPFPTQYCAVCNRFGETTMLPVLAIPGGGHLSLPLCGECAGAAVDTPLPDDARMELLLSVWRHLPEAQRLQLLRLLRTR